MDKFVEQIKNNLKTNGFPQKKVSFPTEKMYELADKKSLSLNKVLDLLREVHGIKSEIGVDKIVFSTQEETKSPEMDFSQLDPDMISKAQEMMKSMDANQLAEIQKQVSQMSPEQRTQMMEKAKSMGIF